MWSGVNLGVVNMGVYIWVVVSLGVVQIRDLYTWVVVSLGVYNREDV